MTAVFEKILEMSATGSLVILVVLIVRLLLVKAPKKYSYLLWSAAAFRLICPVSFRSAFSLLRVVKPARAAVDVSFAGVSATPEFPVYTVGSAGQEIIHDVAPQLNAAASGPSLMEILSVIWCIGIAVILICAVVNYIKVKKRISNAVLLDENVWQADNVRSPLIVGILRPRIYIPFDLDPKALHYALAHERCHLRRFDHILRPVAYLVLALHWFNPLCWLAYFLMVKDMEMSCDEAVLGKDPDGCKAYSITLLSFAANKRFPVPNPLAFGETSVKLRIKNILSWRKPRVWVSVGAIVLSIAVLAACAADPKEEAPQSTPGLKLGSGGSWVLANWYPDGNFDFDYDQLNTITVERNAELIFEPDYPAENLSVGEDLYIESGDVTRIQQKTIVLTADESGEYRHSLQADDSAQQAVYYIPYEEGKFVIKVLFVNAEIPADPPEETVVYTYTLPEYRGTTELDAEIWAALQPPEVSITDHRDIPTVYCGNRKQFKTEWWAYILDADSPKVRENAAYITDPIGLFEVLNIRGWETIYEGSIDRYIDQEGDKLVNENTVYEINLYSERLRLTFIEGSDVCGYSFIDPAEGRATKHGVARAAAGITEAILNFVSPGRIRADYVQLPYGYGFAEAAVTLYSGPGGGVLVNSFEANTLLKVTEAAELDGELWLRVVIPNFKAPGNDEGWLPASQLCEYTEDMASFVDSPVCVPEGEEHWECSDVSEIPQTTGKELKYDARGKIIARQDGYCRIGTAGGKEFWVRAEKVIPAMD